MIFDEIRNDLKELVQLVRLNEQYCAGIHSGAEPTQGAKEDYAHRALRIAELSKQFGI